MDDWTTPTSWQKRFRDALEVLCGGSPPVGAVEAWLEPGCDGAELQNWAASNSLVLWAQGIVVIDAAWMLADTPAEGADHAKR